MHVSIDATQGLHWCDQDCARDLCTLEEFHQLPYRRDSTGCLLFLNRFLSRSIIDPFSILGCLYMTCDAYCSCSSSSSLLFSPSLPDIITTRYELSERENEKKPASIWCSSALQHGLYGIDYISADPYFKGDVNVNILEQLQVTHLITWRGLQWDGLDADSDFMPADWLLIWCLLTDCAGV
jgi:hypothetical protein